MQSTLSPRQQRLQANGNNIRGQRAHIPLEPRALTAEQRRSREIMRRVDRLLSAWKREEKRELDKRLKAVLDYEPPKGSRKTVVELDPIDVQIRAQI